MITRNVVSQHNVTGDSLNPNSVESIVRSTRVMIACAGPFLKHGIPVVEVMLALFPFLVLKGCDRHALHTALITSISPAKRHL